MHLPPLSVIRKAKSRADFGMQLPSSFERNTYSGFEPSQAIDVIYGGRFEHRLLSSRKASMEHERFTLGDVRLETGRYDFPVIARGSMPDEVVCIGMMAEGVEATRYNTATIGPDEIQIYPPGVDLLYHAADSSRWIILAMPEPRLQQAAIACTGRPLTLPRSRAVSVRLAHGRRRYLTQLADDAFAIGRASMPSDISAELAGVVTQEVTNGYAEALSGAEMRERPRSDAARRHCQLILACERLAISSESADIELAEVARRSGYSRRALELIFRRSVGMSPGRWFMNARLNGVLRDLLAPAPGCRIADVAARWGFRHLPRFAQHYHRAFGELPSRTLGRALRAAR